MLFRKNKIHQILIFALLSGFLLAGCGSAQLPRYDAWEFKNAPSSGDFKSKPNTSPASQKATMRPYTINGKTYYPTTVNIGDQATGIASWYGPNFHGKKTSNGEIYNMYAMTAAHKTLPMNTIIKVTNLRNNRTTQVRINDRGPFVAGRIIDLSKSAANKIDMLSSGTAPVRLEVVGFYGDYSGHNTSAYGKSNGSAHTNPSTNSKFDDFGGVGVISTAGVSGGTFMIQIGAFKNPAGAKTYQQKYNGRGGYKTIIKSYTDDENNLHRVFLTGFRSQAEAKDFIKANADLSGAFIVRE